jgi:hypothetical protein
MQNLLLTTLVRTLSALRGELSLDRAVARAPKCIAAVTATVLAAYLAYWFGLHEIWWSAVCAFAITGQDEKTSLNQGSQQIAGTIGGTALGLIVSRFVDGEPSFFILSITSIAATGLYLATSRTAGYMWILSTSLAIYVIAATRTNPDTSTIAMVEALSLDAVVGSVTYWAVNGLYNRVISEAALPESAALLASPVIVSTPFNMTFLRVRNVFAGTLTTSVLAYFAYRYPVDGFAQAMTTAVVILVVPLHVHRDRSMYMVVSRMFHRFLGCLLGSVMAYFVIPIAAGNAACCTIALCFVIWISCHFRFGDSSIAYVGTQSGAVIILAFVHDTVWFNDMIGVAYGRLIGIVAGTIALAIVLVIVGAFSYPRFYCDRG